MVWIVINFIYLFFWTRSVFDQLRVLFYLCVTQQIVQQLNILLTQHTHLKFHSVLFVLRVLYQCKQRNFIYSKKKKKLWSIFVVPFFGARHGCKWRKKGHYFYQAAASRDCLSSRHFVSMNMSMTWISIAIACTHAIRSWINVKLLLLPTEWF